MADSTQQEKNLRLLLEMSDGQMDSLFQLLVDQPDLSSFVARRKSIAMAARIVQRGFGWIAGVIGAVWLGAEKMSAVVQFIAEWVVGVL